MIATVPGYSSYDRRDILVHVVDTEFPKITKIKDLDFEIGQVINFLIMIKLNHINIMIQKLIILFLDFIY